MFSLRNKKNYLRIVLNTPSYLYLRQLTLPKLLQICKSVLYKLTSKLGSKPVFQIRRGNRDNLGITSHISPLEHFVTHH